MRVPLCAVAGLLFLSVSPQQPAMSANAQVQGQTDILIVRSTDKSPEAVVEAVKSYSKRMKWRYIGDSKVKQGKVILVKICIPEVGRAVWPAGLKLSALLPCGNLGVYSTGSNTQISMLHPRYMHVLYPDPTTEKASAIALPLLNEMLDSIVK
jgi:hypothetical protein